MIEGGKRYTDDKIMTPMQRAGLERYRDGVGVWPRQDVSPSRVASALAEIDALKARVKELEAERDAELAIALWGKLCVSKQHEELKARLDAVLAAAKALRIDANRLCDRNLGGTYEDDCRRAIAAIDAALGAAEGKP